MSEPRDCGPFIDVGRAPLYILTFPPAATNEQIHRLVAQLSELARENAHYHTFVVDASKVVEGSAEQRRIFADGEKKNAPHTKRWCLGVAHVMPNAWLRGLLTAIYWITPPAYPYKVFTDREQAIAWATSRLSASAEVGYPAP